MGEKKNKVGGKDVKEETYASLIRDSGPDSEG